MFNKIVVADVTLLNFDQLGKIIYSQSSIFTKIEDVIGKVRAATDLESLKQELLEGNYAKYFKDTFEQNDFQKKWEQLNFIRNKVAHNNYFVHKDLELAKDLCKNLTEIINHADTSIDALTLSIADKEAVRKAIDDLVEIENEEKQVEQLEGRINDEAEDSTPKLINTENLIQSYLVLNEEDLIAKLRESSNSKEFQDFIGLKSFVRDYLGRKGYSFNSSYALINLLADKGKIEIYEVPNPYGAFNTTAIKLIE